MSAAAKPAGAKTPWRDNIEALAMAIVLALLLKAFIVEAYKIPTGSMQPTLMGDPQNRVFDRILVDKLAFRVREPERFEVVVFRYPLDRSKNFVKRLVGMPGDVLRIRHGDLWKREGGEDGPWRVLRRPAKVQAEHWKELDVDEPPSPRWVAQGAGADAWTFGLRSIEASGPGRARYGADGAPVVDDYYHGYPAALRPSGVAAHPRSRQNAVGDLRLELDVTALAGLERLTLELTEGTLVHRVHLPGPAASAEARPTIESSSLDPARGGDAPSLAPADAAWRLPADDTVRVAFENLDDRLALEIAGERVAELEIAEAADQRALAYIVVDGAGASLDDIVLQRDIFYTASRTDEFDVPDGHYFMLGDNTQDSSDSREWSFARFRLADGTVLRGNWRRNENPLHVPGGPRGTVTWLEDEWGERHHFLRSEAEDLPNLDAPYVERDLILGRALAVFWPVQPTKGIWRVKWVR